MNFKKWWQTLNAHEKSAMSVLLILSGLAGLINIGNFILTWL